MAHGTVKFFHERGFGFIKRDGEPDIFFHVSQIHSLDEDLQQNTPQPGDTVEFDVAESKKEAGKPEAINVYIRRE